MGVALIFKAMLDTFIAKHGSLALRARSLNFAWYKHFKVSVIVPYDISIAYAMYKIISKNANLWYFNYTYHISRKREALRENRRVIIFK